MADISKINAVLLANIAEIDDVLAANIAKVNGLVFTSAPAFSGLLDTYSGAAAAYSTRRLYSLYTGAALRVREDSGDTETDIGFDSNGDLDTAAIATHCGSANGYVVKWYGQESSGGTGSGNDAEQSTGTAQPQIYDGTSVNTLNGKPIVNVSGVNIALQATVSSTSGKDLSIFSVSKFDASLSYGGVLGNATFFTARNGNTGAIFENWTTAPSGFINGTSFTGNQDNLYDNHLNSQRLYTGIDGRESTTTLYVATNPASNFFQGYDVQEWVLFEDTDPNNRSGIEGNLNAHFKIGNFGTPTSGLLATYTGAAAAYSVRQLANTAALAMRVREDGSDTELDIGFDSNGDLDTAAIASHCGANNGYVVRLYDQSGNQVDATQATTGSQPQIYNGTAVITRNGKPAIQFRRPTSGPYHMTLTSTTMGTVFQVVDNDTAGTISYSTFNTGSKGLYSGGTFTGINGPGFYDGAVRGITGSETGQTLLYYRHNGSLQYDVAQDGGSTTAVGNTTAFPVDQLGRNSNNLQLEYYQEMIVWTGDESSNRTGIETNINNYFSVF